jgi:alkaline phosphatase D
MTKRSKSVTLVFCVITALIIAGEQSMAKPGKKQESEKQKAKDYKIRFRLHATSMSQGEVKSIIEDCERFLAANPKDPESPYFLATGYALDGDMGVAMKHVNKALENGLPFERFLAGPRDILKPLTSSVEFKELAAKKQVELLHGPMLGCVTDTGARFWVRTATEVSVSVEVFRIGEETPCVTGSSDTLHARDFTAVVSVDGLAPGTEYMYRLVVNNRPTPERYRFTTMPQSGKAAKFSIVFGGGAGYTPWKERIWDTIAVHKPNALMLLGDQAYIDTPTIQSTQKYCYYRRQSRPEFRRLTASTSVSAIWDDHDFCKNDGEGGPKIDEPAWKVPVWETFRNNWNNPSYGGGKQQPGCWFKQSIADVDFFFIDGRYYRSHKNKTMLGPVQKAWLKDQLKSSKATLKILCSNVPVSKGVKPGSNDPWDGFPEEREELFSFIEGNMIEGFFVIAADRHRSDFWKTDRPNGYPIYEFQSSRLTNERFHEVLKESLFGYNTKNSFGRLIIDTTRDDPQVTCEIWSIDNELVFSMTIKRSELICSPGIVTPRRHECLSVEK